MSLYEQWENLAKFAHTPEQQKAYWDEYFAEETKVYKRILSDTGVTYEGKLSDMAEKLGMEPVVFTGFLDGINTSLKKELDMDKLEESTEIKLDIDYEKLYYNMLEAKAKWLHSLSEWEGILSKEKRDEITREWRSGKQAVSEKTAGRNDPCPCGSGKKYKKCCMLKEQG